jgi:type IV pilus assembly protein PilB
VAYTRTKIGELLVKSGLIDGEQLGAALEHQQQFGGKVGAILVEQLIVNEEQLADTLAEQKGLERVSLANFAVDRDAVAIVPERVARRRLLIPLKFEDDDVIMVAMADPLDLEGIDEVEVRSGRKAHIVVATESQVRYAIEKYMASQDAFQDVLQASFTGADLESDEMDERVLAGADVPIVRLVNQLIREAVTDRASDIHIEPMAKDVVVRYRVDGVLHEVMRIPKSARAEITSRLKIMADMNIAERRRPQDGRIRALIEGREVDFRVASLPTPHGESIVIRVLNQDLTPLDLEDLGMGPDHLVVMETLLGKPYGAVLVAGPTGSGKSTSMYAALKRLNDVTRKIITIEEPIEYQMAGVTQMGVNNVIGLSFAAGLRQILRSDPDVVMVGEVRDPETAEIAIRAALTGHLVLSSIHTNDAPSALTRLVDMGVAPYVTSSALLAVVAQRLVRKLCPRCKRQVDLPAEALVRLGMDAKRAAKVKVFGPVGCDACFNTGYRGRLGVFELMVMDDDLRKLFLQEAPAEQLRTVAVKHGMRTLRDDALDKVSSGATSLQEIARVIV